MEMADARHKTKIEMALIIEFYIIRTIQRIHFIDIIINFGLRSFFYELKDTLQFIRHHFLIDNMLTLHFTTQMSFFNTNFECNFCYRYFLYQSHTHTFTYNESSHSLLKDFYSIFPSLLTSTKMQPNPCNQMVA